MGLDPESIRLAFLHMYFDGWKACNCNFKYIKCDIEEQLLEDIITYP